MCLAAPWATRILLLGEKRLPVRLADLRGVFGDGSVALVVAGLIGLLLLTRRWWGRAIAWIVALCFVAATFAIYEFISVFDSLYALGHAHFLADPTFLRGSALRMRHPMLLLALVALASAAVAVARPPTMREWRWWGAALVLCVFGQASLPLSHFYDGWRQRHAVHAQLSLVPVASGKQAGTVGAEVRRALRSDLDGERWLGPFEDRPNVMLIMVEAASGASLPSLAAEAKVKSLAPMPKLDALAEKHLLFSHVVSHQRQTNRGEYGILCGDYPKLLTDQSKMTEQVYGEARRCLPAVLRDAGYRTAYIQAAPLGFMLKDQFMKKAGFDELVGDSSFPQSYARTDWGVDDMAFFEQALPHVLDLHRAEAPFFATLLTVGTHHPFTFPKDAVGEGKKDRQARAFRWADDALGRFISELEAHGVLRDTVVIITSDESAGLVKTLSQTARILAQSWSFAIVMLPEPEAKKVDTLNAHVDIALSISDLLGLEREGQHFVGRSWFREYPKPRRIFAGNTYARRVLMWQPKSTVICDESFEECKRYRNGRFTSPGRGAPAMPRERRLLEELARLTRSGRSEMPPSKPMTLLTNEEAVVPAEEGKKLLAGGQYLRVGEGTSLTVRFDLEVRGEGATVELHQDVFLDGYEKFAKKGVRLRDGQRWRLEYDIGVPRDSSQLVVQLYATTISGKSTRIRFREAELVMNRAPDASEGVTMVIDEIAPELDR